jgi:hypothetical protein
VLAKLAGGNVRACLIEDSAEGPSVQFPVKRNDQRLLLSLRRDPPQFQMAAFLAGGLETKRAEDFRDVIARRAFSA